jgi:hypothetical protein
MGQSSRDDQAVIQRVRERIARGALPRGVPRSILVTRLTEEACAACDETIADSDAAYELEFSDERHVRKVHLHRRCYLLWDSECLERHSSAGGTAG